jgi:hypothetical protein
MSKNGAMGFQEPDSRLFKVTFPPGSNTPDMDIVAHYIRPFDAQPGAVFMEVTTGPDKQPVQVIRRVVFGAMSIQDMGVVQRGEMKIV